MLSHVCFEIARVIKASPTLLTIMAEFAGV